MPFFPNFMRKDLAMWLISLNILALLASVFPWSLASPSTRSRPRYRASSRVVFHESLRDCSSCSASSFPASTPRSARSLAFCSSRLSIVLWLLIPFYDRSKESGQRARAAHYFGLLAVFALLATTVIGYWTIQ